MDRFVSGCSSSGKSSLLAELGRRGYAHAGVGGELLGSVKVLCNAPVKFRARRVRFLGLVAKHGEIGRGPEKR